MEGIRKTAETAQPTQVTTQNTPAIGQKESSVHPELYRYFGVNPIEDGGRNDKLSFLNKWAFEDGSVGKALQKIKGVERKLGVPRVDETRLDKVFNWLRLTNSIQETESEMNKELEMIEEKKKKNMKQAKDNVKPEIEKLKNQIKELESRYKGAAKNYRLNATDRAKRLRDNYSKQLKELKERRKAYGGK